MIEMTGKYRSFSISDFWRNLIPLLLIGGMIIAFGIMRPSYLSVGNILNLLTEFSMVGLVSIGMAIVISAGHVDLSVGHIAGIAAVISSLLMVNYGFSEVLSILLGIAIGMIFGILNGLLVAFLGVSSFIASLGTMFILIGIRYWITGGATIMCLPHDFTKLGKMPLPLLFLGVVALFATLLMDFSPMGRKLYMIGDNITATELCGVRIRKYTFLIFVLSAIFSIFAGEILAARQGLANVDIGDRFMMEAFIGAYLGRIMFGDRKVVIGAILGSALLVFLIGGLTILGVDPSWLNFIKGTVFLGALISGLMRR